MESFEFKIGDNAVYPSHGVGIIKRIEEKKISGQCKSFYVLKIIENGMTIMVPTDNTVGVGLRSVINDKDIEDIYSILRDRNVKIDRTTWNRRYREYTDKIKTGSVKEIAEVLRNLFLLKHSKDLSFGEKKMFNVAKNLLVKEISIARKEQEESIESSLSQALSD